jgi:hypothetical protein
MRTLAFAASAVLVAALSITFAAATRGSTARKPGLEDAVARTSHAGSLRYAFRVGIRRDGIPLALRIRGQSDARTISVHLATAGLSGSELLDGPFLYEHAPDGIAVGGPWRWLRVNVARLPAHSPAVAVMHALTPEPLLRLIHVSRLRGGGSLYRGDVPYDDPVVHAALEKLTGGIEFRRLRLAVRVGGDGLIHRLRLTGVTADRSATFKLVARLYAFGRPVHVSPPKPGTFMDRDLLQLSL